MVSRTGGVRAAATGSSGTARPQGAAIADGVGLCRHARRPLMMPSQIIPASNPPKANRTASGAVTDTPLPGNSTERSKSKMGINPIPSNASQMRSTGRRAAHSPGSSASARPASVAITHAAASPNGSVGVLRVIVMAGMPMIQGQRTQNPYPPPGWWAVIRPAPVRDPTQGPIDSGVDHHHGAGRDQPGHPVTAPGHGVEGLRQRNAGRAVAVQEDRVPVGDDEPVVEEAEDE